MTRITTPFGPTSTASEIAAGIDLSGRRVVVTGAASGIGVETARALAGAGAAVTLAVRNLEAGGRVAAEIAASTANPRVSAAFLDLTDRGSIAAFAEGWRGPLHILVNNAGVMALPELQISDGWEMQLATNHLGHFALAVGLHDALAEGAREAPARIVAVSSNAHQYCPVVFDDLHFAFRPYEPIVAYGQSKTANILFAVEASRRWGGDGITANALNPGAIATNLQRHTGGMKTPPERRKTVEQGAATSVLLAVSPLLEGIGGRYFEDCNEALLATSRVLYGGGVAPFALDPGNAERLWDVSLGALGPHP